MAVSRPGRQVSEGAALLARKPAGRAPGVPLRLVCLFSRPIGQAPWAHEVQDTAVQDPAQPGSGRWRPPTAVTVHRTRRAGTQERSDHRGVAGAGGQEERHLRRPSCWASGRHRRSATEVPPKVAWAADLSGFSRPPGHQLRRSPGGLGADQPDQPGCAPVGGLHRPSSPTVRCRRIFPSPGARQPTRAVAQRGHPPMLASLLPQRWAGRRYIGRTVRMSCSPRVVMASKSLRAMAAKLVGYAATALRGTRSAGGAGRRSSFMPR